MSNNFNEGRPRTCSKSMPIIENKRERCDWDGNNLISFLKRRAQITYLVCRLASNSF